MKSTTADSSNNDQEFMYLALYCPLNFLLATKTIFFQNHFWIHEAPTKKFVTVIKPQACS